ncbi:TetR/AcrR family transcriptional regulator [Lichenicoccus sp.]|uniref:TetR/AcrR family transcriptional regulator n=1 Tax=Lichenicoccus sp. TaxID=2781899 RepID=UPI003D13249C
MARSKSDDKQNAIKSAAIRIIAAQGLSAPTALIARQADVSNGALFTYFATKADLLNQLYIDLKTETGAAALAGLPAKSDLHAQISHMWSSWLMWAAASPEKRRALAHLSVSDEITAESRQVAHHALAGIGDLIEKLRASGPMRDVPLRFVFDLMNAVAETTVDFMIKDPAGAQAHSQTAFEAVWRMLGRRRLAKPND